MELIGLLLGGVLLIVALAVSGGIVYLRQLYPKKCWTLFLLVCLIGAWMIGLPLLGATGYSIFQWLALDEPLYEAASQGDLPKVKTLLKWGADPAFRFEGSTVLQAARHSKNSEVIALLEKSPPRRPWFSGGIFNDPPQKSTTTPPSGPLNH